MRFLATISIVSSLTAVIALVLLIDRSAFDGERTLVVPTATATALPRTPEPTPTPEPPQGHERHVTLIDVETGVTFPLWTETETVSSIAFSADSRWLAFVRSQLADLNRDSAYRVDLQQSPDFEAGPLGEEYHVFQYSARGDLALVTPDGYPAVLTAAGEMHKLANEGYPRTWSPDGRWLSYDGPYAGDVPIPHYLVDTDTWQERRIGATLPCNCDGGPRPIWAPDSALFIYSYTTTRGQPGTTEIYDPFGGASVPIHAYSVYGWIDATHYVQRVNGADGQDTIVSVDVQTAATGTLFRSASTSASSTVRVMSSPTASEASSANGPRTAPFSSHTTIVPIAVRQPWSMAWTVNSWSVHRRPATTGGEEPRSRPTTATSRRSAPSATLAPRTRHPITKSMSSI
jgi:hypothetical protein